MGSFNTTCAISHAPILEGQDVKLFFLAGTGNHKGHLEGCMCYPWDAFKVIGFPIDAKYADYNRYEFDEDSLIAKCIHQTITKNYNMNEIEEGKTLDDYNKYHDYMEVPVEDLNWKMIFDMIHSSALKVKGWRHPISVNFMAVHKDVFDVMMPETLGYYDYETKEDFVFDIHGQADRYMKTLKPSVDMEKIEEKLERRTKDKTEVEITEWNLKNLYRDLVPKETKVGDIIKLEGKIREVYIEDYKEMLIDMAKNLVGDKIRLKSHWGYSFLHHEKELFKDNLEQLAYAYAESKFFEHAMFISNTMYMPIMTSGQEWNFADNAEHLFKIANAVANLERKWSDDDESVLEIVTSVDRKIKLSSIKDDIIENDMSDILDKLNKRTINGKAEVTISYKDSVDEIGAELYDFFCDDPKSITGSTVTIYMDE